MGSGDTEPTIVSHARTHTCAERRDANASRPGGIFFEGLVRLRRRVVARGQAACNLTLTWMKAIVTIENPSMRRMNALTQAFARRMRRSGIFQCEGHATMPSDRRANAVAVNVKRFGTTWQSG